MQDDFYLLMVSDKLKNFKKKSESLYNFSCPICGDSKLKTRKARGYMYEKQGNVVYHCHNCGITMLFGNFLKTIDEEVYKKYIIEKFKNEKNDETGVKEFANKMKPPKFLSYAPIKKLKKVSILPDNDPVRQFVLSRKIPSKYHYKLFSCPNFNTFVSKIDPEKKINTKLQYDETRLLIPFINSNKDIHAFQGRSLKSSEFKYITIILDESLPKIYGLDEVNFNKTTFVFEGPIDSMFIDNSIATAGGDMLSSLGMIDKENLIIVYDNEPRSLETKNKIKKAIEKEYNVCIWPENISCKDVNDMVLSGFKPSDIEHIIRNNTYKSLKAHMALTKWSKV